MVKENKSGSSDSIAAVFEDGSVIFADYSIVQAQEDRTVQIALESGDTTSVIETDVMPFGAVIPIEVAKCLQSHIDRAGTHEIESFVVPDHTKHFFEEEFPSCDVYRQTDHEQYMNKLKNENSDYTFPQSWGQWDDEQRDFWFHQERNYRQAMNQDTVWGEMAEEHHSDNEFKVDDDEEDFE